MTLPSFMTRIEPRALVCDRVSYWVQFHVEALPRDFTEALRHGMGFSVRKGDRPGLRVATVLGPDEVPVDLHAFVQKRENLCFIVDSYPLRAINSRSTSGCDELSRSQQSNWIRADDIRRDNSWAVSVADGIVPVIYEFLESSVTHLLETYQGEARPPRILSSQYTLREIEVAYDFGVVAPNLWVLLLEDAVAALCANYSNRTYRRSEYVTGGTPDGRMLDGFIYPGERIKIYVKTNRRVRLELALSGEQLRMHAHAGAKTSRSLSLLATRSLSQIFANVAAHVAQRFHFIQQTRTRAAVDDKTAMDLVSALQARLGDPEAVKTLLDALAGERRVPSAIGRDAIRKLIAEGIIRRGGRPRLYRPTLHYRRALELIRSTPGFLRRSSDAGPDPAAQG